MNIPTVEAYKNALVTVLDSSPESHRKMLHAHYHAKDHKITATELSRAAGYKNYNAANLHYGKLSAKLCNELSLAPPIGNNGEPTSTYVLATARKMSSYADWEWTLRPEVVKAINELQIFDFTNTSTKKRTNNKENQDWLTEEEFARVLAKQVAEAQGLSKRTRELKLSTAPTRPPKISILRTEFQRNPDVIAEVLLRADGNCEHCGQSAPFCRATDGTPYLEVHHIVPLAQDGEDTVINTLALCPNCHRKMHYGANKVG
jgi:predicted HNH restriction endonuclease